MAATSAGHQTQQQHQQTTNNVGQQKMNNTNATLNVAMTRNIPLQQQQAAIPQIHNLHQQQQQHLMQEYTLKQQQHSNFNMPQQQTNQSYNIMPQQQQQQQTYNVSPMQPQTQHQQQLHVKMQQQHLYQNNQFASNMMPCQNFMTPPPQLHTQPNKFAGNTATTASSITFSNTASWSQQQYQTFQQSRKPATPNVVSNKAVIQAPARPKQQTYAVATSLNHQSTNVNSNHKTSNSNQPMLQQHRSDQQSTKNQQQTTATISIPTTKLSLPLQRPTPAGEPLQTTEQQHATSDNTKQTDVVTSDVANNNNNIINIVKDLQTNLPKNLLTNGLTPDLQKTANDQDTKANLPPGWRRQVNNNNEIVYTR